MQKISICQGCGTIISRSMPRCPVCGEFTRVQTLYEFIPNSELEREDLDMEFDPLEDPDSLLDMLMDAWEKFEKVTEERDYYKTEHSLAKVVIEREINRAKNAEAQAQELTARVKKLSESKPEEPAKKKGLFK